LVSFSDDPIEWSFGPQEVARTKVAGRADECLVSHDDGRLEWGACPGGVPRWHHIKPGEQLRIYEEPGWRYVGGLAGGECLPATGETIEVVGQKANRSGKDKP